MQLMGNWTDKSSRPKRSERRPTNAANRCQSSVQLNSLFPPFFFQLSTGRVKNLILLIHQTRRPTHIRPGKYSTSSSSVVYNPIQSPLSLLSDRSVYMCCIPPLFSFGSPTHTHKSNSYCGTVTLFFVPFFSIVTKEASKKRGGEGEPPKNQTI